VVYAPAQQELGKVCHRTDHHSGSASCHPPRPHRILLVADPLDILTAPVIDPAHIKQVQGLDDSHQPLL
jgi:hypothetical protein